MHLLLCLLVLLSSSISSVCGLFFDIDPSEARCFMEEVPEDTVVYTKYRLELYNENTRQWDSSELRNAKLRASVLDPKKNLVVNKVLFCLCLLCIKHSYIKNMFTSKHLHET